MDGRVSYPTMHITLEAHYIYLGATSSPSAPSPWVIASPTSSLLLDKLEPTGKDSMVLF